MHMKFWWGTDIGDLLFSGLSVTTVGAFVLTCFLVATITVVFEGMKTLETKVKRDHHSRMRRSMLGRCAEDTNTLLGHPSPAPGPSSRSLEEESSPPTYLSNTFLIKLSQVSVYTANTSINYLIMLVVMLFNGYLAVAIVFGTTLGYFIFGHISVKYNMQSVIEKMQVAVVCVPECDGGANESTPPLGQGSSCSSNKEGGACSRSRSRETSPTQQLLIQCSGGKCGSNNVQCCCSSKKTLDPSKIKKSDPVNSTQEECEQELLPHKVVKASCCKSAQQQQPEDEDSSTESGQKTSL